MCTELLDRDPQITAIFAMSDEMVMGSMEILAQRGLRIPLDISIIGFDDILPLHLFSPPITAIRQPVEEMGERALEVLLDTDWDDPEARKSVHIVPVTLIERSSVASVGSSPSATGQQENPE
jgi:transcriptional regulator, LacI family